MNIFEMLYPRFYFDKSKTIRLFEAFAGIGCQAMALKRITDNIELVGISEIDKPAIQSYTAIHGQVKNYGDITKMVSIPPCDIFTWSFPCTDLSKAGKQKGLTDTRSGLVYEVLRLLRETANYYPFHRHIPKNSKIHSMGLSTDYYQPIPDKSKLPKILIMENVIDLVQVKFVKPFNEIQAELEQLGYTNYNEVLNAKDYGIPQNRERVFMVSILGDKENEHYSFDFPLRQELKLRLKDMLEDEVDDKYYLSKKAIIGMSMTNFQSSKMESRLPNKNGILPTICARDYKAPKLTLVDEPKCLNSKVDGKQPSLQNRIYDSESISTAITTSFLPSILIPEATEKGYAEAQDGDGVYINRPEQKRGVVQKGMIQTIKTSGNDVGVVVKDKQNLKEQMCEQLISDGKVQENDVIRHSYTNSRMKDGKTAAENNMSPTLDTRADCFGVVVAAEIRTDEGIRTFDDNNMGSLRTNTSCGDKAIIELSSRNNLRIRKLTPLECWRLMGISDEDFYKAKASGMSNSQLYKQAGNGIVVNVFEAILREMII